MNFGVRGAQEMAVSSARVTGPVSGVWLLFCHPGSSRMRQFRRLQAVEARCLLGRYGTNVHQLWLLPLAM